MALPLYNCIVKFSTGHFIKYRKVSDLKKFERFLESQYIVRKFIIWQFYTIYDHATKQKIRVEINPKIKK